MKLSNILLLVVALTSATFGQRRVDPRNTYHRILTVVPYVGVGTAQDPIRPRFAPAALSQTPTKTDIIGYLQVASDDGRSALVEFVARDMAAFSTILNDSQLKVFEKGKDKKADIEAALRRYKKDFSLDSFGVVMP